MTGRIPLDHLTSDQYDELCDRLEALQAVARGYCPECGRGDASPTAEDWERQRQRADEAEAQLRLVDAMRQQNLDAAAAATQRAETAEAALTRVRSLHSNGYGLCDECTGSHGVPWPCPTIRALDQPGPLTPAEEARLAQAGIHTPGCDCGHHGMGVSWHSDDCPWRRQQVDPTA